MNLPRLHPVPQADAQRFRAGTRIEWFLGPRQLRRTGTVLAIYRNGLDVRTDKGAVRRVLWSCQPKPLEGKAL